MKNVLLGMGFLLFLCPSYSQDTFRNLDSQNWEFKNAKDKSWLSAEVPGTVHTDLMKHKKIPDPFLDVNEKKVQWVEKEDWDYRTVFSISADEMKQQNIDLVFDGLDTFAEIFVNGESVMYANNMFRQWRIPVKKVLKIGKNELLIRFESSVKRGDELAEQVPFETPETPRAFVRKAQYQFGWDWGPRLLTVGIWKDVRLESWNDASLRNVRVEQKELTEEAGVLGVVAEIVVEKRGKYELQLSDGPKKEYQLERGRNEVYLTHTEPNPEWWQPNGWGTAKLYDYELSLLKGGEPLSKYAFRHGFRTVELIQEKDDVGESFYFKVNGKPLYIKGTNWIPGDSFTPRVTKSKYQKLITDAKKSHMNMIRIWGGGIYEDEEFYRLTDENGILVWQDFMFAGSFYPADEDFLDNVKEEVKYQVNRLQNHPSIAIWCGNNEIDEAIVNWGYQKAFGYSEADSLQVWKDYHKVFHELIPNTLKEVLPENKNSYIPTSPRLGWGHKESLQEADSHYWGVWHGEEPLEAYNDKVGRFMSEYGFLGMPTMETVDAMFSGKPVYALDNPVIKHHQKHLRGWELVDLYMHRDFAVPDDFIQYNYLSQLLQARGMKIAIEAHRRNQPFNMGTLIWQLNDVWPVASWSGIDYLGNWKAMQYQTQRSYEPIVVWGYEEDGKISFFGINDRLAALDAPSLEVRLLNFKGEQLNEFVQNQQGSLENIMELGVLDKGHFLKNHDEAEVFLNLKLKNAEGETVARGTYYFAKPKDLKLKDPQIKIKKISNREIELSTHFLAKDVYLMGSNHFSENFFDLLPGEPKRIKMDKNQDSIKLMSLWETMP